MRHVFDTMGTVVSLQWQQPSPIGPEGRPAPTGWSVTTRIEQVFDMVDRTFSLYRPDSELSRVANGTLRLEESSRRLRSAYAEALAWRTATSGAFTPHRLDGVIDLNGIVKALAVQAAGAVFEEAGIDDWSVNTGGDILCSAFAPTAAVGVVDPADPRRLLCTVTPAPGRRAVATSGTAERGDHIWALTPAGDGAYVQVTVLADDIITADVLATAIVAGGSETLDDVTSRWDVDVLTVDSRGHLRATPGFRSALERPGYAAAGQPKSARRSMARFAAASAREF